MAEANVKSNSGNGKQFGIINIYLKDVSFETPNSPAIFLQKLQPEIDFQMTTSIAQLDSTVYEVVLTITVTAKQGDKTAFLVEIQQAGVFSISGHDQESHDRMLGAYCPNTLFPYARAAISDLVTKGGFPPFLLAPVNFRALYDASIAQLQANNPASADRAAH
jgi:preprotein translocase subunit SecB